jgi:hypothetical protein
MELKIYLEEEVIKEVIKKELLALLKEEEIIEIIKESVENDIMKILKNLFKRDDLESKRLKEELEALKKENSSLKQENERLKEEIESLKNKNIILKKENEKLKEKAFLFKEEEEIYEVFESFDKKENIKNIISSPFKKFIYQGADERNLMELWDYIELNLRRGEDKEIRKLIEVFDFFFEKVKFSYPYESYEPVGEEFDPHTMINRSLPPSGRVKEVVLKGIKSKNGKIIKKAVVKV